LDHLWSPWRLDYITGPKDKTGCVFCRHAEEARRSPGEGGTQSDNPESLVLATGAHVYVVLNRYPYNNGHLMVVPYTHTSTLTGLDREELSELMLFTQRSEQALRDAYPPEGINVGINLGRAAGAGIEEHLHIHLVPRWHGDTNFMTVVGETRVLPEDLPSTARRLRPVFEKLSR
jgi:ATP adenylyltransferase